MQPLIYYKKKGHKPYFNRWFSAIEDLYPYHQEDDRHNPYFNRWFSAIHRDFANGKTITIKVTILILIDGFLQCIS